MRSAVGRFFDMDDQLDRKTVLARYSDIPIGNLSSRDPYIQVINVRTSILFLRSRHFSCPWKEAYVFSNGAR